LGWRLFSSRRQFLQRDAAQLGRRFRRVAELPLLHKDPFDRILVAQALVEPLILLTNDGALQEYGSFVSLS